MNENEPGGSASKWRGSLFRLLTGIDLDEVRRERIQWSALSREATADQLQPVHEWMRRAEQHLAVLQSEYQRLNSDANDPERQLAAIREWIRGSERHLAALQAELERLHAVTERQNDQLMRVLARLAVLDSRLG